MVSHRDQNHFSSNFLTEPKLSLSASRCKQEIKWAIPPIYERSYCAVTKFNARTERNTTTPRWLIPEFAAERRQLLEEQRESELVAQVPGLMIFDRCRCGDDFCAAIYTQPKPEGGFGPGHRNVRLMPEDGMLILDVVAGEIACIEILDRNDVRQKLQAALPWDFPPCEKFLYQFTSTSPDEGAAPLFPQSVGFRHQIPLLAC
jgi:hypothetical protein